MTIFQQMNDCNGDAAASEQRVIGSSISHSVTITHSEEFARSVKVSVEGGTGLFEKILASAKIKIGGELEWTSSTSTSSSATTTQSYSLTNTLNVNPGEYENSVVTYSFTPSYNAPFVNTSLVSVVSETSSGAKFVDNPTLIAELLTQTGGTAIITNDQYSSTQIEVQTKGVLSTNGAGGEFTVVNNNLECPADKGGEVSGEL